LQGKITSLTVGTPLDSHRFLGAPQGELYGQEHDTQRFSKETLALLRPKTPIKGLFLTGQDVMFCSFTGALFGGLFCASAVLGRNLYEDLAKAHRRHPPRGD
jgi:all-trans-retinol 13,14-reductase